MREVEGSLAKHINTVQPAVRPRRGSATRTEEAAYTRRCAEVSKLGEDGLRHVQEDENTDSKDDRVRAVVSNENMWDWENLSSLRTTTSALTEHDEFADL